MIKIFIFPLLPITINYLLLVAIIDETTDFTFYVFEKDVFNL